MIKNQKWTYPVLLLLIVVGVYAGTLGGEFIWDDEGLVVKNKLIRSFTNVPDLFTVDLFHQEGQSNSYRPFQTLSYTFDYFFWKLNPAGYHLTNILLHAFVALTYYFLILHLCASRTLAFLVSCLFGVHPLNTEAVAYISGRADSLAALFIGISFYTFLLHRNEKKVILLGISLISYACALLSKEMAVFYPLLLIAYCAFECRLRIKALVKTIIPYLALLLCYGFIRFSVMGSGGADSQLQVQLPGVLSIFVIFAKYIELIFFPHHLHMERSVYDLNLNLFTGTGLLFVLILTMIIFLRPTRRLARIGILWFFVWYFPVSNVIPINAAMAEHWMYMPLLGFLLYVLSPFFEEKNDGYQLSKSYFFVPIAVFIICMSFVTLRQNKVWQNSETFFSSTVERAPKSLRAHLGLAKAYLANGKEAEAINVYTDLIDINPRNTEVLYLLAQVYERKSEFNKASDYYLRYLSVNPREYKIYNSLGVIYANQGQYAKAQEYFRKGLKINPEAKSLQTNLKKLMAIRQSE